MRAGSRVVGAAISSETLTASAAGNGGCPRMESEGRETPGFVGDGYEVRFMLHP
jgi:hypothetical protein